MVWVAEAKSAKKVVFDTPGQMESCALSSSSNSQYSVDGQFGHEPPITLPTSSANTTTVQRDDDHRCMDGCNARKANV